MEESREVTQLKKEIANLKRAIEAKEKAFHKSKKFYIMVTASVLVVVLNWLGIQVIDQITIVASAYLVAQGLSDFGKNKR
jgi:diacylglycerol kinase